VCWIGTVREFTKIKKEIGSGLHFLCTIILYFICLRLLRDLGEVGWGDVDWIGLAQDRKKWRALVNSVLNLRVP
jgi:hypothetical protein